MPPKKGPAAAKPSASKAKHAREKAKRQSRLKQSEAPFEPIASSTRIPTSRLGRQRASFQIEEPTFSSPTTTTTTEDRDDEDDVMEEQEEETRTSVNLGKVAATVSTEPAKQSEFALAVAKHKVKQFTMRNMIIQHKGFVSRKNDELGDVFEKYGTGEVRTFNARCGNIVWTSLMKALFNIMKTQELDVIPLRNLMNRWMTTRTRTYKPLNDAWQSNYNVMLNLTRTADKLRLWEEDIIGSMERKHQDAKFVVIWFNPFYLRHVINVPISGGRTIRDNYTTKSILRFKYMVANTINEMRGVDKVGDIVLMLKHPDIATPITPPHPSSTSAATVLPPPPPPPKSSPSSSSEEDVSMNESSDEFIDSDQDIPVDRSIYNPLITTMSSSSSSPSSSSSSEVEEEEEEEEESNAPMEEETSLPPPPPPAPVTAPTSFVSPFRNYEPDVVMSGNTAVTHTVAGPPPPPPPTSFTVNAPGGGAATTSATSSPVTSPQPSPTTSSPVNSGGFGGFGGFGFTNTSPSIFGAVNLASQSPPFSSPTATSFSVPSPGGTGTPLQSPDRPPSPKPPGGLERKQMLEFTIPWKTPSPSSSSSGSRSPSRSPGPSPLSTNPPLTSPTSPSVPSPLSSSSPSSSSGGEEPAPPSVPVSPSLPVSNASPPSSVESLPSPGSTGWQAVSPTSAQRIAGGIFSSRGPLTPNTSGFSMDVVNQLDVENNTPGMGPIRDPAVSSSPPNDRPPTAPPPPVTPGYRIETVTLANGQTVQEEVWAGEGPEPSPFSGGVSSSPPNAPPPPVTPGYRIETVTLPGGGTIEEEVWAGEGPAPSPYSGDVSSGSSGSSPGSPYGPAPSRRTAEQEAWANAGVLSPAPTFTHLYSGATSLPITPPSSSPPVTPGYRIETVTLPSGKTVEEEVWAGEGSGSPYAPSPSPSPLRTVPQKRLPAPPKPLPSRPSKTSCTSCIADLPDIGKGTPTEKDIANATAIAESTGRQNRKIINHELNKRDASGKRVEPGETIPEATLKEFIESYDHKTFGDTEIQFLMDLTQGKRVKFPEPIHGLDVAVQEVAMMINDIRDPNIAAIEDESQAMEVYDALVGYLKKLKRGYLEKLSPNAAAILRVYTHGSCLPCRKALFNNKAVKFIKEYGKASRQKMNVELGVFYPTNTWLKAIAHRDADRGWMNRVQLADKVLGVLHHFKHIMHAVEPGAKNFKTFKAHSMSIPDYDIYQFFDPRGHWVDHKKDHPGLKRPPTKIHHIAKDAFRTFITNRLRAITGFRSEKKTIRIEPAVLEYIQALDVAIRQKMIDDILEFYLQIESETEHPRLLLSLSHVNKWACEKRHASMMKGIDANDLTGALMKLSEVSPTSKQFWQNINKETRNRFARVPERGEPIVEEERNARCHTMDTRPISVKRGSMNTLTEGDWEYDESEESDYEPGDSAGDTYSDYGRSPGPSPGGAGSGSGGSGRRTGRSPGTRPLPPTPSPQSGGSPASSGGSSSSGGGDNWRQALVHAVGFVDYSLAELDKSAPTAGDAVNTQPRRAAIRAAKDRILARLQDPALVTKAEYDRLSDDLIKKNFGLLMQDIRSSANKARAALKELQDRLNSSIAKDTMEKHIRELVTKHNAELDRLRQELERLRASNQSTTESAVASGNNAIACDRAAIEAANALAATLQQQLDAANLDATQKQKMMDGFQKQIQDMQLAHQTTLDAERLEQEKLRQEIVTLNEVRAATAMQVEGDPVQKSAAELLLEKQLTDLQKKLAESTEREKLKAIDTLEKYLKGDWIENTVVGKDAEEIWLFSKFNDKCKPLFKKVLEEKLRAVAEQIKLENAKKESELQKALKEAKDEVLKLTQETCRLDKLTKDSDYENQRGLLQAQNDLKIAAAKKEAELKRAEEMINQYKDNDTKYQAKLNATFKEIAQYKSDFDDLNKKMASADELNKVLKLQLNDVQSVYNVKIQDLQSADGKINLLTNEINQLKTNMDSTDEGRKRLQALNDERNERIMTLEGQLRQARDAESLNNNKILSLERAKVEFESLITKISHEKSLGLKELNDFKNQLQIKELDIKKMGDDIFNFKKTIEENKNLLLEKESALSKSLNQEKHLKDLHSQLEQQVKQKGLDIAKIEDGNKQLRNELNSREETINKLKRDQNELNSKINSFEMTVKGLTQQQLEGDRQLTAKTAEIKGLESQIEDLLNKNTGTMNGMRQLELFKGGLVTQLADLNADMDRLKKQLREANDEMGRKDDEIRKLGRQDQEHLDQFNRKKSEYDDLVKQLDDKGLQFRNLQGEKNRADSDIANLKNELQANKDREDGIMRQLKNAQDELGLNTKKFAEDKLKFEQFESNILQLKGDKTLLDEQLRQLTLVGKQKDLDIESHVNHVKKLQTTTSELETQLVTRKQELSKLQDLFNAKDNELKMNQRTLDQQKSEFLQLVDTNKSLQTQIEDTKKQKQEKEIQLDTEKRAFVTLKDDFAALERSLKGTEAEKKLLDESLKKANEKLTDYMKTALEEQNKLKVNNQTLEETRTSLERDLFMLKQEKTNALSKIESLTKEVGDINVLKLKLQDQLNQSKLESETLKTELNLAKDKSNLLESSMKVLESEGSDQGSKFEVIRNGLQAKIDELSRTNSELVQKHQSDIADLSAKVMQSFIENMDLHLNTKDANSVYYPIAQKFNDMRDKLQGDLNSALSQNVALNSQLDALKSKHSAWEYLVAESNATIRKLESEKKNLLDKQTVEKAQAVVESRSAVVSQVNNQALEKIVGVVSESEVKKMETLVNTDTFVGQFAANKVDPFSNQAIQSTFALPGKVELNLKVQENAALPKANKPVSTTELAFEPLKGKAHTASAEKKAAYAQARQKAAEKRTLAERIAARAGQDRAKEAYKSGSISGLSKEEAQKEMKEKRAEQVKAANKQRQEARMERNRLRLRDKLEQLAPYIEQGIDEKDYDININETDEENPGLSDLRSTLFNVGLLNQGVTVNQ